MDVNLYLLLALLATLLVIAYLLTRLHRVRGQLSLHHLVLLSGPGNHSAGVPAGRAGGLETPGQHPALAGGK